MPVTFDPDPDLVSRLTRHPDQIFNGAMGGSRYTARIAIPNYQDRIRSHYKAELGNTTLDELGQQLGCPPGFRHFGIILKFEGRTNVALSDHRGHLMPSMRALIDAFGPIVLHNACVELTSETAEQRNIFPHMRFHFDRSALQESQISLFSRDPDDAEQRFPRQSSTLFVANIVAWLQSVRQGISRNDQSPTLRASYDLFGEENARPSFGDVIFEQPWNEPEGTGELCVIDNRTVLHASFHGDLRGKGWRIGARYLI
jgi:hypothetical protein